MKKHLLLCALLACAIAHAFEYTLPSGDYDVRITARFKHTIRSISYKGTLLGLCAFMIENPKVSTLDFSNVSSAIWRLKGSAASQERRGAG